MERVDFYTKISGKPQAAFVILYGEQLKAIQKDASNSLYFGNEITGVFLPHLIDYHSMFGKWGGVGELIKRENYMSP